MQRDGEEGRKKIAEITRYVNVALALIEAIAMAIGFSRSGYLTDKGWLTVLQVIVTLTAGSAVLMWIGERITEKGVGNGISIVLVINIISRIPSDFGTLYEQFVKGKIPAKAVLAVVIIAAHFSNRCLCRCPSGSSRKDSGTVFEENSGKKAGRRSVYTYSSESKYRWSYPGYLRTVFNAVPGCYCFSLRKGQWNRNWQ